MGSKKKKPDNSSSSAPAAPVMVRGKAMMQNTNQNQKLTTDTPVSSQTDLLITKNRKGKKALTIGQGGTMIPTSSGETSGVNIPY